MKDLDHRGEPSMWLVIFYDTTGRWWVDRLVPGRFKHVALACWCEETQVWVFLDVGFAGSSLKVLPRDAGDIWAARQMASGVTVQIRAQPKLKMTLPLFGWCVPAVRRMIGLRSSALLPTTLYRDLVAANAEIVHERTQPAAAIC